MKTNELTGRALDWAVAKCEGRALSEPKNATNESVKGLRIPFQLWDVCCTYYKDELIKATPSPIVVNRFGVDHSVGAITPSISFSDARDKNARGSVDMFYMSQEDAQQAAEAMLKGTIEDYHPSTNWSQGGPIIEQEGGFELKVWLESSPDTKCEAHIHNYEGDWIAFGPTPLIAAMRCFCASRLGDEVEVPDEIA